MRSVFEESNYKELTARIEKISSHSEAQWGSMSVAQMLHHCQKPLEVPLGKSRLKKPNFFLKTLLVPFRKGLYNDTPWKKGLPTAREFVVKEEKDFEKEKNALLEILSEFYKKKDTPEWEPHPVFGSLTHDQWGKMQYKHLDHHLSQFGV